MVKKISMLVGLFALFFGLAACGNNYDAFELLQNSHEVMEGVESMIIEIDTEIDVDAGFMSMEMPISGRIYMEILSETEANLAMEMAMEIMDQPMDMSMYFRDGYLYTDMMGDRERTPMDMEEALEALAGTGTFDVNIDEDWIESSSAESTGEGYQLSFTLNEGAMIDMMGNQGDALGIDELSEDEIEIGRFTMVVYLDEDYYQTSSELDMEMTFTVEETDATMEIRMVMDIVQLGDVSVEFPDWLDQLVRTPIGEHDLLGTWDNGSGGALLWVFGSADSVEFRANGTVIITEDGDSETVDWVSGEPGHLTADDQEFTYSIAGDALTITDSANDDWTFVREGAEVPEVDDEEDEAAFD